MRTVALEDELDESRIGPAIRKARSIGETPEMNLIRLSDRAALHAAMEKLPAPLLEVILLCDVEEMKYREIATVLEIPIGTVMSRIARARAALRGALQVKYAEGVARMTDHLSSSMLNALADGELSAEELAGRKRASCRLPRVHLERLVSKPAQIRHSQGGAAVRAAAALRERFASRERNPACRRQVCALSMRSIKVKLAIWLLGWAPRRCFWLSPPVLCLCSTTREAEIASAEHAALVTEVFDQHIATLAGSSPPQVVSTDRHTVKPWFQGKIPFSFNLPENLPRARRSMGRT